jgi:broad specificity phosphatase PhoE
MEEIDVLGNFDEVFLARHGQTAWNVSGRRQGQLDSPLTDRGRSVAHALATRMGAYRLDGIYSSPLGRALSTARICAAVLNLDVVVVSELAEVHHGLMAGLNRSQIEARFPGILSAREHDKYRWSFPEGESYELADARAAAALRRIADKGVRRPLIVSHEMIGKMLVRVLLDAEPAIALTWNHPHNTVFRVDPQRRTREELKVTRD